jgi:hypothetical protein
LCIRSCVKPIFQVVEEKRATSSGSTALEVEKDAEEADQEFSAQSELRRTHGSFGNSINYLKHLKDPQSHRALLKSVQQHLWNMKKYGNARTRLDLMTRLTHFNDDTNGIDE